MTELRDLTPHVAIPLEQSTRDRRLFRDYLPELVELERILSKAPVDVGAGVVERITLKSLTLPTYRIDIGAISR